MNNNETSFDIWAEKHLEEIITNNQGMSINGTEPLNLKNYPAVVYNTNSSLINIDIGVDSIVYDFRINNDIKNNQGIINVIANTFNSKK